MPQPPASIGFDKLFPLALMHVIMDPALAPVAVLDFDAVDERSRAAACLLYTSPSPRDS